jgi:hypothetical protein
MSESSINRAAVPHETYIEATVRSIVCMLEGREPVFPMEVTVADPQGLIARLRVSKVGGETQTEVLELDDDSVDSDAPTFPIIMCAVDAAGTKFGCAMYEDMSPIATLDRRPS